MYLRIEDVSYEENINDPRLLCKMTLKAKDIEMIQDAVEELYYFEFVAGMKLRNSITVSCIMYKQMGERPVTTQTVCICLSVCLSLCLIN